MLKQNEFAMNNTGLLGSLIGVSTCVACLIVTSLIFVYGTIRLNEPNLSILLFEFLSTGAGTIINGYLFIKHLDNRVLSMPLKINSGGKFNCRICGSEMEFKNDKLICKECGDMDVPIAQNFPYQNQKLLLPSEAKKHP